MTPTARPDTGDTDGTLETEAVDWTDEGTFERAEEARLNELDDDSRAVTDGLLALPAEANEADVLEQLIDVGDDEEDAPRDA